MSVNPNLPSELLMRATVKSNETPPYELWEVDADRNYFSEAEIDVPVHMVSGNVADVQSMFIVAIKADGSIVTVQATLNGQTPVNTGITAVAILDAYVIGGADLAGAVYLLSTTDVTAGIPDDFADVLGHVPQMIQRLTQGYLKVPNNVDLIIPYMVFGFGTQSVCYIVQVRESLDVSWRTVLTVGTVLNNLLLPNPIVVARGGEVRFMVDSTVAVGYAQLQWVE